jgi:hypothetical protein
MAHVLHCFLASQKLLTILCLEENHMYMRKVKFGTMLFVAFLFNNQAYALTIDDAGVVGSVDAGTQSADVGNVTDWANYLLSLGTSTSVTTDGNNPLDGVNETYETGINDYSGTLTGGTRINGSQPNINGFEWVMAKYDGQNAGYVLFNVADYLAAAAAGTNSVPEFSYTIWGTNEGQYQLSNITGFGGTPVDAPMTLLIMSLGLFGVGLGTWKKKHQA